MKTNPSENDKLKNQNKKQDADENSNKKRSMQSDSNKMNGSSKFNKGTGMSSEAGASQTEESWQGTGGSQSGTPKREEGNKSYTGESSENLNTDNIKNQSEQQRRASMDDDTPETGEKNLKNEKLPEEELNDVDWDVDEPGKK